MSLLSNYRKLKSNIIVQNDHYLKDSMFAYIIYFKNISNNDGSLRH